MVTNNNLPDDVRKQYRLVRPIKGGPVFDFPAYGLYGICFAATVPDGYKRRAVVITPAIAARLVSRGCPLLAAIPHSPAPATAPEEEATPAPRRRRVAPDTEEEA